jgi:CRISPR-associated protein Cas1
VSLANTNGQILEEHLLGVSLMGILLTESLNFKVDKSLEIKKRVALAAIFHDIGKLSENFQSYIISKKAGIIEEGDTDAEFNLNPSLKSKKNSFVGPFHNEISWAFFCKFINMPKVARDIVSYAIYWHHPAFDDENGRVYKDSEVIINKVGSDFDSANALILIESLKKKLINLYPFFEDSFTQKSNPEDNQISTPDFTQFETAVDAEKRIVLAILIEADRIVSRFTSEELQKFILKPCLPIQTDNKSFNFQKIQSKRSDDQFNLASEMTKNSISICGADPGSGKTSISLYWWNFNEVKLPLMIALPRQNQVTGIFNTLIKDTKRIFIGEDLRIKGFFNGQIQHDNIEQIGLDSKIESELDSSNINIMVFDRLLSPCYERKQNSEFLLMLKSHLVLDEFHEFTNLHRMRPALKEVITIRSWFDPIVGPKTLLISGTPEPALVRSLGLDSKKIFTREKLEPFKDRLISLRLLEENKTFESFQKDLNKDTLFTFLKVKDAQLLFSKSIENSIPSALIHSEFTDTDKKKILNSILVEYGENGLSRYPVLSSKMLQSSYDLNFRKAFCEISLPFTDCQTIGRVNRFGNKDDAEVNFFIQDSSISNFNDNRGKFKIIYQLWLNHLKSVVGQGVKFKYRDLIKNLYDDFWTENTILTAIECLNKYENEERVYLKSWYPKRISLQKNKKNNIHKINRRYSFRGESLLASAVVVNNDLKYQRQLTENDLLSVSSAWEMSALRDACKQVIKPSLIKDLNSGDVFDFSKYTKSFGLKDDLPFLFSHISNSIDNILNYNLKDKNLHQVYHPLFGLIEIDHIPKNGLESFCNNIMEIHNSNTGNELKITNEDQLNLEKKRSYTQVDEKNPLIPLSRRVPIFYIEYSKLVRKGSDIRVLSENVEKEFTVPVGSLGALLLGPGSSITTEAARIASSRGCVINFVGGGASPLFLTSTQHRSPLPRIRQHKVVFDIEKRLKAAKKLFLKRKDFIQKYKFNQIPNFPDGKDSNTIEHLLSIEGQWAKQAYKNVARSFDIKWSGLNRDSDEKHPIVFLNFLTYSIADIAIIHLGFDPNIGVLHGRTKGGGLCYDLADVIKPGLALIPAFTAIKYNYSLSEIKNNFMKDVREYDVIDYLVNTLTEIFGS